MLNFTHEGYNFALSSRNPLSDLITLTNSLIYVVFSDIKYVEEVKGYCLSQTGNNLLVDQRDYTYYVDQRSESTSRLFWACTKRGKLKCKARAVTYYDKITKLSGEHIHEPDFEKRQVLT